jgi:GR25 family glycosyltransferase involved in LPS biosynthesis
LLKTNYLDGIDAIYWINLQSSVDRRNAMLQMFHDIVFKGIPIERINASDGKREDIMSKFTFTKTPNTKLEYACLLSHLNAIKTFSESKYNIALIMEDDATLEFKPYWKQTIKQIMKSAPSDWEIIQLCYIINDNMPTHTFTKINNNLLDSTKYFSMCAYIIKKDAAKKLIQQIYLHDTHKYILHNNIKHEADIYIYSLLSSYTYKYPFFIYKTDNDSNIHDDHIEFHNKSKRKVLTLYNTI